MAETKRKYRVLVVEDEDNIALALDFLMSREGYDHDRVADGAEALPLSATCFLIWCCWTLCFQAPLAMKSARVCALIPTLQM